VLKKQNYDINRKNIQKPIYSLMREKIVNFWESRVLDFDLILGVIFGATLSILMNVAVHNSLISWNIGTIFMTVILSLSVLSFAPIINLGFVVGFYLLTFCIEPKENIEFLVIFFVFFLFNFLTFFYSKNSIKNERPAD